MRSRCDLFLTDDQHGRESSFQARGVGMPTVTPHGSPAVGKLFVDVEPHPSVPALPCVWFFSSSFGHQCLFCINSFTSCFEILSAGKVKRAARHVEPPDASDVFPRLSYRAPRPPPTHVHRQHKGAHTGVFTLGAHTRQLCASVRVRPDPAGARTHAHVTCVHMQHTHTCVHTQCTLERRLQRRCPGTPTRPLRVAETRTPTSDHPVGQGPVRLCGWFPWARAGEDGASSLPRPRSVVRRPHPVSCRLEHDPCLLFFQNRGGIRGVCRHPRQAVYLQSWFLIRRPS